VSQSFSPVAPEIGAVPPVGNRSGIASAFASINATPKLSHVPVSALCHTFSPVLPSIRYASLSLEAA
jgi:hypothetical protein